MKIAFVPIDNRPVCYTLPEIIASCDKNIEFSIPNREFLGDLTKQADTNALMDWLDALPTQDAIILSLDTLVYGGLIPSRRCPETLEQLNFRLEKLKNILKKKQAKIYAFSSIMRISNNNYNQEEKEYWAKYGKKIFKYSYDLSKNGSAQTDIPQEILTDYLNTRKRNFQVNKTYLNWKIFNTLIFSKDDCAEFGLNVDEAKELEKLGGLTKTGADEIPLSLLARAIKGNMKICPIFLEPKYKDLVSNYEDIPVEKSVKGQIELAGCEISDENSADILLYINNFKKQQGEIVMGIETEMFDGNFVTPNKPYMIADIRFANGADNNFVNALFKNNLNSDNFYGYSGWNTSANTLGSLICAAKVKFLAQKFNRQNFETLQITRFLDDWAYQANVRQLMNKPDIFDVAKKMQTFENKVTGIFKTSLNVKYNFPWNRLFEIEIFRQQ